MKKIALLLTLVFLALPAVGWGQSLGGKFWNSLPKESKKAFIFLYAKGQNDGCTLAETAYSVMVRRGELKVDDPELFPEKLARFCKDPFDVLRTEPELFYHALSFIDEKYSQERYQEIHFIQMIFYAYSYYFMGTPLEEIEEYLEEARQKAQARADKEDTLNLLNQNAHDLMGQ